MDAGALALTIIGVLVGGAVLLAIISWLASFYYFDHR